VVPAFPSQLLPQELRCWVTDTAQALQVPADLPAMLALSICGAGVARRFRIEIRDGWQEPVNLFAVVALPPGERKSAAFADALAPVRDFESSEAQRLAPIIAEAATGRRQLEATLKALEAKIAKPTGKDNVAALREKARQLAREIATHTVPAHPQFMVDDITAEALAKVIAEQGGRMLQASAEGAPMEIAKGRYSEGGKSNFEVYLKGHAGDDLRVNRTGRAPDIVENPALSVALAVQPDVLAGLSEQESMARRGFLARFLYSLPVSNVGRRAIGARPVSAVVRDGYRGLVMHLWRLEAEAEEPIVLTFSPAADQVLRHLEVWLEPQLAEGEELSFLAGWANKLAGACARIAGIFHLISSGNGWNQPIEAATVEAAVSLGRDYLLPHAKAAFRLLGADEKEEQARRVWQGVLRLVSESSESSECRGHQVCVSRRAMHQAIRTRKQFNSAEEVDPAIDTLVDRYYLRPLEQSGSPGRGNRSPEYLVSPTALALYRQKAGGRTHYSHNTHNGGGK
jgi:hypothetical protein